MDIRWNDRAKQPQFPDRLYDCGSRLFSILTGRLASWLLNTRAGLLNT